MSADALIFALPPVPRYGGRPPEKFSKVFGAQNLSDGSEFPPGHWALGVQNCRWCGSISAPGFDEPTLPVRILAGRSGTGPYKENEAVLYPP